MSTKYQILGQKGELRVVKACSCPRCKRSKTLRRLPTNFKCADVICDFCGFLAQVKTDASTDLTKIPPTILGAAWSVQKARMDAGIYFPLFLVLMRGHKSAVYYLSADVQRPEMFKPRNPLGPKARRAGWQGFLYLLEDVKSAFVRVC
jgi:hypothetical protein